MKCGICNKTDGLCYTSLPPKVKCTVTGKFHEYDDECDAGIVFVGDIAEGEKYIKAKSYLCTHCIVCDAPVELTENEEIALNHSCRINPKVCDECKQAIMRIRNWIDAESNIDDPRLR